MKLLMDSGAFSAWNNNQEINLDEYIQYCTDNLDAIDNIVALDVIPGKPGYKDIPLEEREAAAAQGYENYQYMIKKGLDPQKVIVVFHQGDHFHWLERLRDDGVPYIGLSPANDRTTPEKMKWLDECMYYATDSRGFPLQKWHGFAVTSVALMKRFPWYSVDSATWIKFAAYGTLIIPTLVGSEFIWDDESPSYINVSNHPHSKAQGKEGKHMNTLTSREIEKMHKYFALARMKLGTSTFDYRPETYKPKKPNERWIGKPKDAKDGHRLLETIVEKGLCNDFRTRARLNAFYFANVENSLPNWPWAYKRESRGFGLGRKSPKTIMTCPWENTGFPLNIFLAGNSVDMSITHRYLKRLGFERNYRRLVTFASPKEASAVMNYKREVDNESRN